MYNFAADIKTNADKFSGVLAINDTIVDVSGRFIIHWDGSYPVVQVTECTTNGQNYNLIDFVKLARKIEATDNGEWYLERMNKLSEEAR